MIGILAAIALAAVGLSLLLGAAALMGWKAALDESRARGDARELAAERGGELGVAAKKIEIANEATTTAVEAEHQQEQRGDGLEKDLAHEEARPHGGLAGLSDLSTAEAVSDSGAGAGASSSKR